MEKKINLEKLKKQLIIDEGVKYEIYFDHLGYPTFGIGHLITKQDPEYWVIDKARTGKVKISEERVNEVFEKDIEMVLEDCKKLFNDFDEYLDEVKQIIANMMFNLGLTRLSKFKNFCKAIREKNYKKASLEMIDSLWYRQVPNRAKRLVKRMEKLANKQLCNVD